jgi:hypothetical protein
VSFSDVLHVKYEVPEGESSFQCFKESSNMKTTLEIVQDSIILLTQYVIPVLVMLFSYTMIALTLWRKQDIDEVVFENTIFRQLMTY